MDQLAYVMQQMIELAEEELRAMLGFCKLQQLPKHHVFSTPGTIPHDIYFINSGLVRVIVSDRDATEHTMHFALENQFIADYSAFMRQEKSMYALRTEEPTELVVLPRDGIEWGYANLKQGDRLGRLIAEFYFIYQDNRLKNLYARTPKERYDSIGEVFPNIHNRVPQHMIASYLGITPVHLSRLKKADR